MIDTSFTWRGHASLDAVLAGLRQHGRAEIRLPADSHHALWRAIGSPVPGTPEVLDVAGGIELLRRVAEIESLAELAQLADALAGMAVAIQVVSPSPVIRIDRSGCTADAAP